MIKYLKIINFVKENGQCDYKGLDIEKNIPGSQIYPINKNIAVLKYKGDLPNHPDIIEISEEAYLQEKEEYEAELPIGENEILKLRLQEAEQAVLELSTIIGGMLNV